MNQQSMLILIELANRFTDGHFTIFRFTTNWKVGLGTLGPQEPTLATGDTFEEAVLLLIAHKFLRTTV